MLTMQLDATTKTKMKLEYSPPDKVLRNAGG